MKISLYMAVTANGYIAKENGETPWSEAEWKSFSQTVKQHRNIVIGRKTFEVMRKNKEFEKIGHPFVVVLSKKKKKSDNEANYVTSPKEGIRLLRKKGFKRVLISGGGKVNGSFIKEQLIDEIIIDIEPQIFGKGIKLFADETFETKLKFLSAKKLGKNTLQLKYKVLKK